MTSAEHLWLRDVRQHPAGEVRLYVDGILVSGTLAGQVTGSIDEMVGLASVYAEVAAERARAHALHGDTSMESYPPEDPTGKRYRILVEEVGEVAKEFNDADHDGRPVDLQHLRKELIQVAAMASAWADAIGDQP